MNLTATFSSASTAFFQRSAGRWHSQRRYYTLNGEQEPLEAVSELAVIFLPGDHPDLKPLAIAHQFTTPQPFECGAKITWASTYTNGQRKPLQGATVLGIQGSLMYRDRGFSTAAPVIATFELIHNAQGMRLQTAYDGASFEEEIKFVGDRHRTRQTIISRAGQEVMIGQYLETRL
ncbi:phycobiliprotein lyase [Picosynechococcus sp. NKBG15041c]|uniref:phycobiliprotein lyase n=1 Tax=Picosynechococcus sp. NKBG15041c TaxID=1407650 RepID=UPI00040D8B87|nr:phycobiliprotein lyase [Picosynechococcus sp. NKBG15041c]